MDHFKEALGPTLFSKLDETTLEYMVSVVSDKDSYEDDIIDTITPMLQDGLSLDSEDEAKAKAKAIMEKVRPPKTTEKIEEKKILNAPVLLARVAQQQDEAVMAQLRVEMPADVNFNRSLAVNNVNSLIDASLDETAQRNRIKTEKKELKKEKRDIVREQRYAKMRDEIMKRLETRPVKLHNTGALEGGRQRDIKLEDISMVLGSLELLKDVSITFSDGRKYGLIGKNGMGKTTFLKHLAAHAFEGIPSHLQILHIEQEVEATDESVLQTVLACDVERTTLLKEEKQVQALMDMAEGKAVSPNIPLPTPESDEYGLLEMTPVERAERLADIFSRLQEIDSDASPAKAGAILAGLGFTPTMQGQATRAFSGGWRMRIALAEALFISPDILLLDEPTNHLDLHAVLWLEEYLEAWQRTIITVSHDRDFLNSICTDIIHLDKKKLIRYKGNYDDYEKQRADVIKTQNRQHEVQEKERAHLQAFVDKNRVRASTAKMAQSRVKMLEKMELIPEISAAESTFKFSIPQPDPLPGPIVTLIDVTFGYSKDRVLYKGVSCNVAMGSRAALVGANGVGKSTLLKLILNELEPVSGMVKVNPKASIARFTQHHVDQLDMKKTPFQWFKDMYPQANPQDIRKHLGGMGLTGNLALQPIYSLSGGQKSRVAFAHCTWQKPHLLLLDEPTNHLDMETIDGLIRALNNYDGGVLVVSHDAHLISTVCDEIWVCENNSIKTFNGDFDDYRKVLSQKEKK